MAIPVLAGIPFLAGVLGNLFAGLFTWFMQYMTKRFAMVAAAVVVILALTTGLFSALQALLAGVSLALPANLAGGVGMFLPSNLSLCASIIITAHLLRYAYDWNIKIIQYKLF